MRPFQRLNTQSKNYLLLLLVILSLVVVGFLADFGDDKYLWERANTDEKVKYQLETELTKPVVLEILKTVRDPEIDINVVDLGLILDVVIENDTTFIDMILTTPYCPYAADIIDDIKTTLFQYDLITNVALTVKSEPAWSYDRLSDDGKKAVKTMFGKGRHHGHDHLSGH